MAALYYCHECGNRLTPEEQTVSEKLGEKFTDATCSKCAADGKRMKRDTPPVARTAHSSTRTRAVQPSASAVTAPTAIPRPKPQTQRVPPPPKPTTGLVAPVTADAPPAPAARPMLPYVLLFGGVGLFLIGVTVFLVNNRNRPSETESKSDPASTPVATTPAKSTETYNNQEIVPLTALNKPATKEADPTVFGEFSTESVEEFLRYKNFTAAFQRIESIEKKLPQDEKYAPVKTKLTALREDCKKGSKTTLEEILKSAEEKANAGDKNAVHGMLAPTRLSDLLPDDAEVAAKDGQKWIDLAESNFKANEQKKAAEAAAARAAFESKWPSADAFGAAPKSNVLVGPDGMNSKVKFKEGKEALRTPQGKASYLDGTRKVFLDLGGVAGVVNDDRFVIEYTATKDMDVWIWLNLQEFGDRGGNFKFKAGERQKLEINPEDEKALQPRGKKGKATGRTINALGFETKNCQAGNLAVYRISR
ncbi:MAG TPA: hypothetical protein VGP72_15455 [Planctomycetota bacterium]|jgi:hypothetical protein